MGASPIGQEASSASKRKDLLSFPLLSRALTPGTYASYGSKFVRFARFCMQRDICPLPASEAAILAYVVFLADEGVIGASSAQPYFTAINRVHEDAGLPAPARSSHWVSSARRSWQLHQRAVAALNHRMPIPASVVLQLLNVALSLPIDPAGVVHAPEHLRLLRSFTVIVWDFLTFSRSQAGVQLLRQCVDWSADGNRLHYRPTSMKGKILAPDTAVSFELHLDWFLSVRVLLCRWWASADRAWARAAPPCTPATLLGAQAAAAEEARAFAFALPGEGAPDRPAQLLNSWMAAALQHAGIRPPAGVSWSSHSLRSGAASAARAVGVPEHIIAHRGGWAQDSSALRRRYIDPSIQPSPAAGMFFGWLVPPPLQRPGAP